MFSFSKSTLNDSLNIFVKSNTGNTVSVGINPKWDIKNVKSIIAPQLGLNPEEVKIILAGKELEDSTLIEVWELLFVSFSYQSIFHEHLFAFRNATWESRVYYMQLN